MHLSPKSQCGKISQKPINQKSGFTENEKHFLLSPTAALKDHIAKECLFFHYQSLNRSIKYQKVVLNAHGCSPPPELKYFLV